MRKYFEDCISDEANVLCIEQAGTDKFISLEISDNDGEHEPKQIKLTPSQALRVSVILKRMAQISAISDIPKQRK
mgnify:CR=1 FL=1